MTHRFLICLAAAACHAAPTFTGSAACAECHPSHWERQSGSSHATALRPMRDSILAARFLRQGSLADPSFRYSYEASPDGVLARVAGQGDSASMTLLWAFGSGSQAYTAVGRFRGRWIEHRISLYTASDRFSLTPGHFGRPLLSAGDALGIVQDPPTIARCFSCHATGARSAPDGVDLSAVEPGVQCERCHGPASDHIAAARRVNNSLLSKTILNPGRFSAEASVMVCGECHRTPPRTGGSAAPELDDPLSVRFQPVGLMASRCFQVGKRMSCLTCHDPHESLRRDETWYVSRCLECHQAPPAASSLCRRAAGESCLPCHMRRIQPAPNLFFVDHRIRVYSR